MVKHAEGTRMGEASSALSAWGHDATSGSLSRETSGSLSRATGDLEAHAAEGCSICARSLVNTRELAVSLAVAGAAPVRPSDGSRGALLSRTRALLEARRPEPAPPSRTDPPRRPRVLDPSAAVAHRHVADPSEAARIEEVDALRALEQRPGDGTNRLLEQLARFVDFPLLFVSIVRGERVGYRAQRGLPDSLASFRDLRRDMSYCTHTVSGEAPLVVENGAVEPFFRGNRAVTRFGVVAYAGVPLRSTRGLVVGTLCALDFKPRPIPAGTVALLEVFARRARAEIEGERTPGLLASVVEATSPQGDLLAEGFFRDLVAAQHARLGERTSALLTLRTDSAERLLGAIDEHEVAGRLGPGAFGVLLPDAGGAALRLSRLKLALMRGGPPSGGLSRPGADAVSVSLSTDAERPADWVAAALAAR
jgi:hypothetical protein